uniref:Amino acid permease/ SLC12A domain-containing protein n=1 Tax=Aureoumbra lagunensis TaxID=44058 RepID=A0A7S3JTF4_9STRA|mmetsp:Transcript_8538/g.13098  ORF Transcript_8538/g.13098 Transcript_8538/m.13098 type:complete len:484 (+) Transcript_8538:34-1485(+)
MVFLSEEPDHTLHRFNSLFDLWITGVGAVIAGDLFGWTAVLTIGIGGAAIVVIIMAIFYFCMAFSVAELAASPGTAEGGTAAQLVAPYLGQTWSEAATISETLKLISGTAACVTSVSAYLCNSLDLPVECQVVGWGLITIGCGLYAAKSGGLSHSMMIATTLSSLLILALLYTSAIAVGHTGPDKFDNIKFSVNNGRIRFAEAVVFSAWFFIGVEGLPLVAPVTREPTRFIPRAIVLVMMTTTFCALATVISASSVASTTDLIRSGSHPLYVCYREAWRNNIAAGLISFATVLGLLASLNAFLFYSSQLLAQLATDAGITDNFPVATATVLVLASFIVLLPFLGSSPTLIVNTLIWETIFAAFITYLLQFFAFLQMRKAHRYLESFHWRSPFGIVGALLGLLLNLCVLAALFVIALDVPDYRPGAVCVAVIFFLALIATLLPRTMFWTKIIVPLYFSGIATGDNKSSETTSLFIPSSSSSPSV